MRNSVLGGGGWNWDDGMPGMMEWVGKGYDIEMRVRGVEQEVLERNWCLWQIQGKGNSLGDTIPIIDTETLQSI